MILETQDVQMTARPGWITIEFPPLNGPLPRHYTFYVDNASTHPVVLQAHLPDMYPEGDLVDGTGDLVFQARFRPTVGGALTTLLGRLAEEKPGLAGMALTYSILLLGLAIAFFGFTRALLRSLWQDRGRDHSP